MFTIRAFTVAITVALLAISHAQAANVMDRAALIATDPVSACNPPNNGGHKAGSSCKFFSGPSNKSPVISGHCALENGRLICVR